MKGMDWKYIEASQRTVKAREGQGCICAKEMKIGTSMFTNLLLLVILGFFPVAEQPSSYSRKYCCHIASPQKERNWLNSLGYKFKIFKRRSLYIGWQYFSLTIKMSYGEGEEGCPSKLFKSYITNLVVVGTCLKNVFCGSPVLTAEAQAPCIAFKFLSNVILTFFLSLVSCGPSSFVFLALLLGKVICLGPRMSCVFLLGTLRMQASDFPLRGPFLSVVFAASNPEG